MVFDRIDRGLMPWHVLVAWVIALAALAYLGLATVPHLHDIDPDIQILSLHFAGYEPEVAHEVVEALGHEGVEYYGVDQVIGEMVFAVGAFGALMTLFLILTRTGNHRFDVPLSENLRLAVVGVIVAAGFGHLLGSFATWGVLAGEPPNETVIHLASTLTAVMTIAYVVAAAAVLATVIVALLRGMTSTEPIRS